MDTNSEKPPMISSNAISEEPTTLKKHGRPRLTDQQKQNNKEERKKKKLRENMSEEAKDNHRKANIFENMSEEAKDNHRKGNIIENMNQQQITNQNNKLKNAREKNAVKYTIDEFDESNIEVKFTYHSLPIYNELNSKYYIINKIILGTLSWTNGSNL